MVYMTMSRDVFNHIDPRIVYIIMDEDRSKYPDIPNLLMASVLLPPYEALSAYIDGDQQGFNNIYCDYLSTYDCDNFITMILASWLVVGRDVIIFIEKENSDIGNISGVFLSYIFNTFGVTITESVPTQILNDLYMGIIVSKFFKYDLIMAETLTKMWPKGLPLLQDEELIVKLAYTVRPYIGPNPKPIDYYNYFNENIKLYQQYGMIPQSPFIDESIGVS